MPMKVEKLVGVQIAKIRKERDLTQSQLAELVDVATETISRMERGISMPSLITLEKISNALNTPLKDIFDFETCKESPDFEMDRETAKLLTYLKTKTMDDIKMSYRLIKSIFEQIEKNYRQK